jgi:hypothetical protein
VTKQGYHELPEWERVMLRAFAIHAVVLDQARAHIVLHFLYRDKKVQARGFEEGGDFEQKDARGYDKALKRTLKRLRKVKGDRQRLERKFDKRDAKVAAKGALAAKDGLDRLGITGAERETP